MVWLGVALLVAALVAVVSERRRRRDWQDLTRPGMPARRRQQDRGVGHLGEAPVAIHHRLGGRSSDD
ncbi:hypothetical protein CFI00_18240 [Nocardioides sp. S5]|uniref:hypothetical protein n=1 Tax=Nocardioides sp. S5 TaxID=2017486 RepID=UPI001A8C4BDD|nr:hypothetical protein [Nocardioides sp. S5]QSR32392.1 hypothetical protein CFI00_18240 [Nocardioides sp. S5]